MTDPIEEFAQAADALPDDGSPAPARGMLPRDPSMSRQMQRRLYRMVCRARGIEPQLARPTDKKQRRAARKQSARLQHDRRPRGRHNTSAKWINGVTRASI